MFSNDRPRRQAAVQDEGRPRAATKRWVPKWTQAAILAQEGRPPLRVEKPREQ